MTLQTERFYPNYSTGRPWADTAARHAWTAVLAASCTTTGLAAALCAAGTIAATINPLTAGPLWQLLWAPILGTATVKLTRYTAWLARTIRART